MTRTQSFAVTLVATLAIWFGFMISAIVIVKTLSDQAAINLLGGILVFAVLLSTALLVDGYVWLRWVRQHRP